MAVQDPLMLNKAKKQLQQVVHRVLTRTYREPIDRFVSLGTPTSDSVAGSFASRGRLIGFSLNLGKESASTWIVKDTRKDGEYRSDAQKKCGAGFSCGNSCISKKKKCIVKLGQVATPGEIRQAKQIVAFLRQEEGLAIRPLEEAPIRDMRKIAAEKGVSRYSRMKKEQLALAIKAVDSPEAQRQRLLSSLEKKRQAESMVNRNAFSDYAKDWRTAQKIMKLAGAAGGLGLAAAALYFYGRTKSEVDKVKANYVSAFPTMADQASVRADKLQKEELVTDKDAVLFLVGGYKNENSYASVMRNTINSGSDANPHTRFLKESHQIIEFQQKYQRGNQPPDGMFSDEQQTRYSAAYSKFLYDNAVGGFFDQWGVKQGLIQGVTGQENRTPRNEDALELAAQIYATAMATKKEEVDLDVAERPQLEKEFKRQSGVDAASEISDETLKAAIKAIRDVKGNGNTKKIINVLAHGAGGGTAREAMEIIYRMKQGKGIEVLRRVNLVTLGSAHVGITEQRAKSQINITNDNDPFNTLQSFDKTTIPTVRNREVSSFLRDENAIQRIAQQFDFNYIQARNREIEALIKEEIALMEKIRRNAEATSNKKPALTPTTDSVYRRSFRRSLVPVEREKASFLV